MIEFSCVCVIYKNYKKELKKAREKKLAAVAAPSFKKKKV